MQGFLLSLGILLGIVTPQPDPVLAVRLFRSNGQLSASVEVRNAVNTEALKLIQAGNPVQLILTIVGPIGDTPHSVTHRIAYDPVHLVYIVEIEETASEHQTVSQSAAIDIYSRFYGLNLAPASDISFPAEIDMHANLAATGQVSFDPAVLWNYHIPTFHVRFSGLSDYHQPPESTQ